MPIKAFNVYSNGGIFDYIRHDPWNQRRSYLAHTEFGNGILAIWSDSSRWDPVIKSALQRQCNWAPTSKEVWQESFRRWTVVKSLLLDHSQRIYDEFQTWRFNVPAQLNQPFTTYCVAVSRWLLAQAGRYDEWINSIEKQVNKVEDSVQQLGALTDSALGSAAFSEFAEENARGRLIALTEAGKSLKLAYSGRDYFNHGDSD